MLQQKSNLARLRGKELKHWIIEKIKLIKPGPGRNHYQCFLLTSNPINRKSEPSVSSGKYDNPFSSSHLFTKIDGRDLKSVRFIIVPSCSRVNNNIIITWEIFRDDRVIILVRTTLSSVTSFACQRKTWICRSLNL